MLEGVQEWDCGETAATLRPPDDMPVVRRSKVWSAPDIDDSPGLTM